MTRSTDSLHIEGQKGLTAGDLIPRLDLDAKSVPLHIHGIHSHMNQEIRAVLSGDTHGVLGIGHLGDCAIDGGDNKPFLRLDAAILPEDTLRKYLVGDLLQRDVLPGDGGVDAALHHVDLGDRCCASQQLIKQSHDDAPFR